MLTLPQVKPFNFCSEFSKVLFLSFWMYHFSASADALTLPAALYLLPLRHLQASCSVGCEMVLEYSKTFPLVKSDPRADLYLQQQTVLDLIPSQFPLLL